MYKVRKLFSLPIGHRLSKHQGLCKNIHGHNIKIEVQLKSGQLNENDMIIDFHDLKIMVNKILDDFDHATILNEKDVETINYVNSCGDGKLIVMTAGNDPTAERLSKFIYDELQILCESAHIFLDFVRIWENDTSMAEYNAE